MAQDSSPRLFDLIANLRAVVEEASGVEVADTDIESSFLEQGLDSLLLTQIALTVQKTFSVKVSFRQLLEDLSSVRALAQFIDGQLPPEVVQKAELSVDRKQKVSEVGQQMQNSANSKPPSTLPEVQRTQGSIVQSPLKPNLVIAAPAPTGSIRAVIEQQLRIMEYQIALLGGAQMPLSHTYAAPISEQPQRTNEPLAPTPAETVTADLVVQNSESAAREGNATSSPAPIAAQPGAQEEPAQSTRKPFGAMTKISLGHGEELSPLQRSRLDAFIRRFNARTAGSKQSTQKNRRYLADPRVVSGFRPILKELVYPIVVNRSSGSKFWDVDGNEYIDVQCGFGQNLFGWSPPFIIDVIKRQLETGIEIGPQHPLAGEVAEMFCELTGFERAAFCNTGSEAVMAALRVSRTVTGRKLVATFSGDYHGMFDEVIVRGTKKLRSLPAAPGILPSAVENMLVLDYGEPESLNIIRQRSSELAAVLVEPVQSRRPELQPKEFLHELRRITESCDIPLIFDEVVTGMRVHPAGAQAHFGVKADIGTYGKIIGGGLPIGIIAGRRQYMDALDGGHWEFGDDSTPTVGVTYFAGTFVRHPAALAAAKVVLTELQNKGPALQDQLASKVEQLAGELNAHFAQVGVPMKINYFRSIWRPVYTEDLPFGDLLFYYMRDAGIHIRDGFPCFLTTAHSDEDVAKIIAAFKACVAELQASGFLPGTSAGATDAHKPGDSSVPPVPGARLGRDPDGNPAWYAPNPNEPGKYVRVGTASQT
jgi:glutamate-1-semialdehyde aminotransferase/acyl carrier protein